MSSTCTLATLLVLVHRQGVAESDNVAESDSLGPERQGSATATDHEQQE